MYYWQVSSSLYSCSEGQEQITFCLASYSLVSLILLGKDWEWCMSGQDKLKSVRNYQQKTAKQWQPEHWSTTCRALDTFQRSNRRKGNKSVTGEDMWKMRQKYQLDYWNCKILELMCTSDCFIKCLYTSNFVKATMLCRIISLNKCQFILTDTSSAVHGEAVQCNGSQAYDRRRHVIMWVDAMCWTTLCGVNRWWSRWIDIIFCNNEYSGAMLCDYQQDKKTLAPPPGLVIFAYVIVYVHWTSQIHKMSPESLQREWKYYCF